MSITRKVIKLEKPVHYTEFSNPTSDVRHNVYLKFVTHMNKYFNNSPPQGIVEINWNFYHGHISKSLRYDHPSFFVDKIYIIECVRDGFRYVWLSTFSPHLIALRKFSKKDPSRIKRYVPRSWYL